MRESLTAVFKLASFALPLSAGALINMVSSFAAMFMVAKLGEHELAAAALAVPTFMTITMIMPVFYAVAILISHYRGQEKALTDIGELVRNGLWLAVILASIASVFLWNADRILLLFGQDPQLIQLTPTYFHFAALSLIPMLIVAVVAQFYSGIGHPRFTLHISMIGVPAVILLSYGMILGKAGFT